VWCIANVFSWHKYGEEPPGVFIRVGTFCEERCEIVKLFESKGSPFRNVVRVLRFCEHGEISWET